MNLLGSLSKVMTIVTLCLLVGGALACERRQPSLIGKWQSASGETFEFFKDGTVTMRGDAGPPLGLQTFIGNYKLIEGNRLRLDMTSLGVKKSLIFSYDVSRESLTLKNEEKGDVCTYRRVEGTTMAEGPGPAEKTSKAPPQQAKQPLSPVPHLEPLQQPPEGPKTHTDRFSLDEVRPPAAPAQPNFSPPAPRAAPPPQAAWGGRWAWTSARLIQPDDLMPLSLRELELMRNEIYARHGWVFNRQDLRDYFSRQPWYSPKGDLSNRDQANYYAQAELTPLEKKNIQIIVQWEKGLK